MYLIYTYECVYERDTKKKPSINGTLLISYFLKRYSADVWEQLTAHFQQLLHFSRLKGEHINMQIKSVKCFYDIEVRR